MHLNQQQLHLLHQAKKQSMLRLCLLSQAREFAAITTFMMESASLVLRANTNTAVLTAMGLIPALSAHF